jgi:hypothetical protein
MLPCTLELRSHPAFLPPAPFQVDDLEGGLYSCSSGPRPEQSSLENCDEADGEGAEDVDAHWFYRPGAGIWIDDVFFCCRSTTPLW